MPHDPDLSRRAFLAESMVTVAAGNLLLPRWARGAEPPRAAVLERPHEWCRQAQGAGRLLAQAGFRVEPLQLDRPPGAQGADLIVLGSFASEHADYKQYMHKFAGAIPEFVRGGGVVLQFTQADQTEALVPFLPDDVVVRRCDDDVAPLLVAAPEHPLLRHLALRAADGRQTLDLPDYLGRPGNWESLAAFENARVLMTADAENRRPILLEAALGRGRCLITSLYLDAIYGADGGLAAPAEYERAAIAFFRGLREYAELVQAGNAPAVTATPPYREPAPLAYVPGSQTLVALPDTQIYAESFPRHFHAQTEWIVAHKAERKIQYVLHLGDITNRNTPEQWNHAREAMTRLHGHVPYALAPGNHDYGPGGNAAERTTLLNEYFPRAEYASQAGFGGTFDSSGIESSFHTFRLFEEDVLLLALEWGPRDEVVAWADEVARRHPSHRGVLITHAYTYSDETRYDWAKYREKQSWNPHAYGTAKLPGGVNDGEELWKKLVEKHPGFFLTVNGHVLNDGLGRVTSEVGDRRVHQHLVNYQMHHEGGDGFLRLYEFLPDGKTVQVKAYSPSLDKYKTDPQNQFVFELRPALRVKAS